MLQILLNLLLIHQFELITLDCLWWTLMAFTWCELALLGFSTLLEAALRVNIVLQCSMWAQARAHLVIGSSWWMLVLRAFMLCIFKYLHIDRLVVLNPRRAWGNFEFLITAICVSKLKITIQLKDFVLIRSDLVDSSKLTSFAPTHWCRH